MHIRSNFPSLLFLALTILATTLFGQEALADPRGEAAKVVSSGTDVLACWDFSGLIPDETLSDGLRVSDICEDHDARVVVGLDVIEGVTPDAGALAFTSASTDALVFEPGYDFGDSGPPAGEEFDFAGTDSFTLEAVVRIPEAFTGAGSILAKDVGPGQASWWFRVNNGVLQALVSDGNSQSITGSQIINDGQWHHVALVRDASGDSLNLYVDYQLDESVTIPTMGDIATPAGTPIAIGAFNSGSRQLEGDIQVARITREGLSPGQFLLHDEVANVSVTMSHDGQPLTPGGTTQYEITVSNAGPTPTSGVAVEALMPAEFTDTAWTCTANSGANCTASGSGDLVDTVDLPVDASVVYTVEADLAMDLPLAVTYTASIEPGVHTDFNLDDNVASVTVSQLRLHVDHSADLGGDGASWATAFRYLQDALATASSLTQYGTVQIWVAGGVYYPDEGAGQPNNSRSVAFELADEVELYGGFDGTEIALEERDWLANPTVLSGDIGQDDIVDGDGLTEHWNDIVGSNSYHVVRGDTLDSAVLDGFSVTGGKADGGSVIGGVFLMRDGAGINLWDSSVRLTNLRIQGNFARASDGDGGGLRSQSEDTHILRLTNVTFEHNHAELGGAMNVGYSRIIADRVHFHGNEALGKGGALYQYLGWFEFRNSTFTGNSAAHGGAIYSYSINTALAGSLLSGNYASDQGGAIYFFDPSGVGGALVLTNVTMTGNRAGNNGGAIYRHRTQTGGGDTETNNTIIWDNEDSTGVGTASSTHAGPMAGSLTASHSLLHGLNPGGDNNFDGTVPANAPEFLAAIDPADAPTSAGNFRIEPFTPLMDAGDNQARINPKPGGGFPLPPPPSPIPIEGNILFDLNGAERIVDGDDDGTDQIDLGPYESLGDQARSIGGTVSGLTGNGLVLQNNGGDDLPIAVDGSFTFATAVADGSSYDVTVSTQPTGPSQTCSVTNGTGVVNGGDVTNIQVNCVTDTFTLGGNVSGLEGDGLVLQNNGGDDLPIAADGSFAFATAVADGSSYDVTVSTQPTGPSQTCSVTNGTGVVNGGDVTNIQVNCVTDTFTLGGNVSGLEGDGLVLQNNGGDDLPIAADGSFTFATALADGSNYEVTVSVQPTNSSQTCNVTNGTGVINGGPVIDIQVDCVTDTFTLGGNVSGLEGDGLVLQNGGGDDLSITADGNFTFATALTDGSNYDVTVSIQPTNPSQTCSVTNGTGVVNGDDVIDIQVDCATDTYTLGGTVSGLSGGGLVLRINGGDDLAIESNGPFEFETPLADGTPYEVTVWTQPGNSNLTCSVTNGTGVVDGEDVADIAVNCVDHTDVIFSDRYEN